MSLPMPEGQKVIVKRVSDQFLEWINNPESVPESQPHCTFCNSPKVERNKKCELCGGLSSITGKRQGRIANLTIENY